MSQIGSLLGLILIQAICWGHLQPYLPTATKALLQISSKYF